MLEGVIVLTLAVILFADAVFVLLFKKRVQAIMKRLVSRPNVLHNLAMLELLISIVVGVLGLVLWYR